VFLAKGAKDDRTDREEIESQFGGRMSRRDEGISGVAEVTIVEKKGGKKEK